VIRGCVPKKLMHYGAHFAEYFELAQAYGWSVDGVEGRLEAMLEARNREITRLSGIYIRMLKEAGVETYEAYAKLRPERAGDLYEVEAGDQVIRAKRVLVAVGGRPTLPAGMPGRELADTSDEVLEAVYPLPRRLAVIGAGYIGVELASIMNAFGAETGLIYRADLPLRGFDGDLRRMLADELAARGMLLRSGTTPHAIRRDGDGYVVETDQGDIAADKVILATGRGSAPNTGRLGLEPHGVRTNRTGAICVDERYETSAPGIFAIGDCSDHAGNGLDAGSNDLTPVAIAEGRALAETVFNDNPVTVSYSSVPTAVFGLPQASAVGLTEEAARELGHDVVIYRTRFRPMLYTLPNEERRTMMKLVVDRGSDKVLGCHMVGDDAGEIIQGFAVALTAGATKATFDCTVALHPTAAEEFVTMYQPVTD
jgi:glutathione reductase (NADPH)